MFYLDDVNFSFNGEEFDLTDELSLKVQLIDDNYETPDYYGEFTDCPDKDTIKVDPDELPREYRDRGELWFTSENSLSEQRAWYTKNGYSKHEAYTRSRNNVIEDCRNYLRHCNNDATIVGLSVEIIWRDEIIGEDSLFGIVQLGKNYGEDRAYLLETLSDVISMAFDDAIEYADSLLMKGSGLTYILENWKINLVTPYHPKQQKIERIKEWRKGKISYQFMRLQTRAQLYRSGVVTKDYNIVDWRSGSQSHEWPADLVEALGYIK